MTFAKDCNMAITTITIEDIMEQMEVGPSNRKVVEAFLQKSSSLIESEMREAGEEFVATYFPEFWEQYHENLRDAETDRKLHSNWRGISKEERMLNRNKEEN